jgi:hypothetical protein
MDGALIREIVRDAAIGVAVADAPEGLSALRRPGCAAAIWRRQPMSAFQAWLDAIPPERLPNGRVILRPEAVRDGADRLSAIAGTPEGAGRDRFCDDVAALAEIFTGVMDTRYLRLRLAPVDTDGCRRFHVDAMRARLVCTYRGPGTQYAVSTDGTPPSRVFQVPTGAPILMRGTLWPGEPVGIMHRSPPIEGTGITRLVLVLVVVDDPEGTE